MFLRTSYIGRHCGQIASAKAGVLPSRVCFPFRVYGHKIMMPKRIFSSGAGAGAGAGAGSGTKGSTASATKSLFRRAAELYCVLLGANYISNVLTHPTAKVDYGFLNKFFPDGREVDSPFWGTRLPHLFAIPASLAFFDMTSTALFTRYFGLVSFAATPGPWLINLYAYTFIAVGSFIAFDAALNPNHEGRRMDQVTSHIKPLATSMGLQWHAQMMLDLFGSTASGPLAIFRNAFALSLVFLPVKALGFGDMGEAGLTPHERKMNGLKPKEAVPAVEVSGKGE